MSHAAKAEATAGAAEELNPPGANKITAAGRIQDG